MPPDIEALADELGTAFKEFKTDFTSRLDGIEKRMGRPGFGGSEKANDPPRLELNSALRRFLRNGDPAPLIEIKAMSVGSSPDGGYATYSVIGPNIINRMREMSPMRQVARVIDLPSGDAYEEVMERGDTAAVWVGETQPRLETDSPTLSSVRIPLNELTAQPRVTQKLLDTSSFDVAAWLSDALSNRFARAEGTAFFSGDGVLQPRGLTTYSTAATGDATRALGVLEHVNTGVSGDFSASNPGDVFFDMVARLGTGYRPNARWMMNRRTMARVRKFKGVTNDYLWQPGLAMGQPQTLIGYPVIECEDMPDIGAGSLSIAFGDFSRGYTIIDRLGMRLVPDPYTAKPHVIMFGYKRVGGGVTDFDAIKLLRFA